MRPENGSKIEVAYKNLQLQAKSTALYPPLPKKNKAKSIGKVTARLIRQF